MVKKGQVSQRPSKRLVATIPVKFKSKIPSAKPTKKKESIKWIAKKFYRINTKNKKPYKAGMFFAMNMNGKILIGFSLCNYHAGDRYDYVNGVRKPGHGMIIARERCKRWIKCTNYLIGPKKPGDDQFKDDIVHIPGFIVNDLYKFILKCEGYFRIAGNPEIMMVGWVADFMMDYIPKHKMTLIPFKDK